MSRQPHLTSWIRAVRHQGGCRGHRSILVISGERSWGLQGLRTIASHFEGERQLVVGAHDLGLRGADHETPDKARDRLGTEYELLILDLFGGLFADVLGAVSGVVCAGGIALLFAPPLSLWGTQVDAQVEGMAVWPHQPEEIQQRFLQRFKGLIENSERVHLWVEGQELPASRQLAPEFFQVAESSADKALPGTSENVAKDPLVPHVVGAKDWVEAQNRASVLDSCLTEDQKQAVLGIWKVAEGRKKRPLIIVSDRGRGKTSSLGLAAGLLLLEPGSKNIIVTAPKPQGVKALFDHAKSVSGQSARGWHVQCGNNHLRYLTPGTMLAEDISTDLLLIDEAAALPVDVLKTLVNRHRRVVFSTTIHGYEGTGRGFALRFHDYLNQNFPGWHRRELKTPIRWSEGDPFEAFVYQALMLDAEPAPAAQICKASVDSCVFERVDRQAWLHNDADLRELFGLMVVAHYRTSPSDLMRLMDAPNVQIFALRHEGRIVAALWANEEGAMPLDMDQEIRAGSRRPHGHMLPATLSYHEGMVGICALKALRIVRIAVHPAVQGRGLGSACLSGLYDYALKAKFDYLGTAFGASASLLRFWKRAGYYALRLGVHPGKSSGLFACVMARPISDLGQKEMETQGAYFAEALPALLADPLSDLDVILVDEVLLCLFSVGKVLKYKEYLDSLDEKTRFFLEHCAQGVRDPDLCAPALAKFVPPALRHAASRDLLSVKERHLLIQKVLQHRSWSSLGQPRPVKRLLQRALAKLLHLS